MEPAIQAPFSPEQQKWYEAACAQINRLAATACCSSSQALTVQPVEAVPQTGSWQSILRTSASGPPPTGCGTVGQRTRRKRRIGRWRDAAAVCADRHPFGRLWLLKTWSTKKATG